MTPRELEEYKALRATIRERGTARHWIVLVGFSLWADCVLTVGAFGSVPVEVFIPLTLLVATFEVVFALHTGVERVGRYLQVFYEPPDEPARWEHVAMTFGQQFGGGGTLDALFSPVFLVATVFNLIPAVLTEPVPAEWVLIGVCHALFAWRVRSARQQAAGQRALDLDRFTQLKSGNTSS